MATTTKSEEADGTRPFHSNCALSAAGTLFEEKKDGGTEAKLQRAEYSSGFWYFMLNPSRQIEQ